jgi:very-short-patch-repair endonuclease
MRLKERNCCFCNIKFKGGSSHIFKCKNKPKKLIDKNEIKFQYIKYNFPEISNKEKLYQLYIIELNSLPDLNKLYGLDYKSSYFLLDYFNIKRRTISESALKISSNKSKKTNLIKYGTINVLSKGSPIYEKRNKTVKEKYGVDNVFQIPEIIEKIQNDLHYIEKYGLTRKEFFSKKMKELWNNLSDEQKNEWLNNSIHSDKAIRKAIGYRSSKLETKIANILLDLNINFDQQFLIRITNKRRKFYDFYLKKYNIIIEVQGDYWHANPESYKKEDLINYRFGGRFAEDIWKNDEEKKILAETQGYNIIFIWEKEIYNTKNDIELSKLILNKMKEKLNELNKNKIN